MLPRARPSPRAVHRCPELVLELLTQCAWSGKTCDSNIENLSLCLHRGLLKKVGMEPQVSHSANSVLFASIVDTMTQGQVGAAATALLHHIPAQRGVDIPVVGHTAFDSVKTQWHGPFIVTAWAQDASIDKVSAYCSWSRIHLGASWVATCKSPLIINRLNCVSSTPTVSNRMQLAHAGCWPSFLCYSLQHCPGPLPSSLLARFHTHTHIYIHTNIFAGLH